MGIRVHTELIKESVPLSRVISTYCSAVPKNNRIPCPIHNGKNANFWFNDEYFYCHVCKASGDIFSFVQHIFGLSFPAALDKLNADFNLGIPLDRRMTLREQREAEQRYRKIMAERKRKEEEERAYEELYDSLHDEWHRLDQNRVIYAPETRDEEWHPLFVEALRKIEYQKYLIDELL